MQCLVSIGFVVCGFRIEGLGVSVVQSLEFGVPVTYILAISESDGKPFAYVCCRA